MKAVGLDFEGGAVGCASGERTVEKRSHEADMAKKNRGSNKLWNDAGTKAGRSFWLSRGDCPEDTSAAQASMSDSLGAV